MSIIAIRITPSSCDDYEDDDNDRSGNDGDDDDDDDGEVELFMMLVVHFEGVLNQRGQRTASPSCHVSCPE